MRTVTIMQNDSSRPTGLKRYFQDYTYYTPEEAKENNIDYHENWRDAHHDEKLKVGDYVLTEDGKEVIPLTKVIYGIFPLVRTPNGTFGVLLKSVLDGRRFRDRFALKDSRRFHHIGNNYQSRPLKEVRRIKKLRSIQKAVFNYLKTGDPAKAYKAAYKERSFYKKMNEAAIYRNGVHLVERKDFKELYMEALMQHWKKAGLSPAEILEALGKRVTDGKENMKDTIDASKLLFSLHPDTVASMVAIDAPKQVEALPQYTEFEEIEDGPVEPGKHLTDGNGKDEVNQ